MGWELFRRDSPGGFEMVGVDGQMLGEAPVAHLPVAVEITITAPSTLPGELSHTEQAIVTITDRLGGRIAGTIRSASTLWTLVYLPTDREAGRLAEIALPARASIDVAPAVDPDWQIFDRVRPVGVEQQSLADLAVMAALHDAGDRGGVRRVEHVVTGLADDRRDEFGTAVSGLGFSIGADRDLGGGADVGVTVVHDADPADITDDAWTLRLIAERFGATYDGWGCPAVRAHGTAKRRWWRR